MSPPISPLPVAPSREFPLDLLRCPRSGVALALEQGRLVTVDGQHRYDLSAEGIPLFAAEFVSEAGRAQRAHYDRIAAMYVENLGHAHTQEYMASLDDALLRVLDRRSLGTVAEICCGRGEAFRLLGSDVFRGVGVDVSLNMLKNALHDLDRPALHFLQGDATILPLVSCAFDSVFMLGGIHHVQDRAKLFSEVARILRPGGRFYFREPVSDFLPWRAIRAVVYRLSPVLNHMTERPLLWEETVPVLEQAGLRVMHWTTHGFLGFCVFMNSDVLLFNRLFRFVPGIRAITRAAAAIDEKTIALSGLSRLGLQVVGVAEKPS